MKSVVKDIPKGYKESVLGVIPDDWSIVRLKDRFDRITTKNKKGLTNVLTISAQHGLINQEEYFNKSVASKNLSNYTVLEKGDFAYNKSYSTGYPYGAIKKLKKYDEGVVSPLYICFRPSKNNKSPDFYEQYFEAGMLNREIHAIAQEGARNHGLLNISIGDFFNTFIIDADEKELNKIAEILNTWDKAIELKEKLIELKKEQKKGLMQKLLTGEVRLPGFNEKWEKVRLGNICSITTGKLDANAMKENGKYKFFTCAKEVYSIDEYAFDTEALLVSGNGANVGYIHYYNGKFNAYQRTYVLDQFSNNILFIKYLLDENLKRRIHKEKNAGNTPYITMGTLSDMYLSLPSQVEQYEIAKILEKSDYEIDLLEKDLEYVKNQKQGLMQLLLTGKVRVKV